MNKRKFVKDVINLDDVEMMKTSIDSYLLILQASIKTVLKS